MTKAKNHVSDLIESRPVDITLPSKNAVRRAANRVNSEMSIITTIIDELREVYAMSNEDKTSTVIDTLEEELDDIGNSVDICVAAAEKHLEDRINAGETKSILLSVDSKESSKAKSTFPSKVPSRVPSAISSHIEQRQLEAKESDDRLHKMEMEQQEKEQQMRELAAKLELTRQRTEKARKIAEINKSRAKDAEKLQVGDGDTVKDFLAKHQSTTDLRKEVQDRVFTRSPVKLKGVESIMQALFKPSKGAGRQEQNVICVYSPAWLREWSI